MRTVFRVLLGGWWLLASAQAWSAAALSGMVSLNRERGAPAAGVEVSARGANPMTTGNDGQFLLTFPDGHPGQDIRVQVKPRAGWEVVNDILLDHRLPDSSSARPLEIIVSPSAERELRVAEFYRLKGNQAVEQTYKAKLAELEGRQAATAQERDRLVRERDQALNQVEEWARQSASRRSDEVTGTYRDALRLFLNGQSDAALQLLSDELLQREAERAHEQLKQAVQGWVLKGQLLSTRFDYAAAGLAYEQAVKYGPASLEAWSAYAYFHQQQNHYALARRGYEQALPLARQKSDEGATAETLNNLGVLSRAENRNDEARKQHEEALTIRRRLAQRNPHAYLPDVSATLNNLAILSNDENRNDEARTHYEEALGIRRALAKTNPDVHLPDVAATLNNFAILNRQENRNDEARGQYEEALLIYRNLAGKSRDTYLPAVATTLNNLGILNSDEKRNSDARKQYQEALDIRRTLAKTNPEAYQPYVADTLSNFGVLNSDEGQIDAAREQYQEALNIYRTVARNDLNIYQAQSAAVLVNLGTLNSDDKRHDEARRQFEEALAIQRVLARGNPEVYLPYVARTLNNLGIVSHHQSRPDEALRNLEEALDIRRALAKKNPDAYLPDVAVTLNNVGHLYYLGQRPDLARRYYEEALTIFRTFARKAPAAFEASVREVEDGLRKLPK